MGILNRGIPRPLGTQSAKRKAPETQAGCDKAERDDKALKWGQERCEAISQAIKKPEEPINPSSTPDDFSEDKEDIIDHFVFIAFMHGSQRTSKWGHPLSWDNGFNIEDMCSCSEAQKHTRAVDTVDLIYCRKMEFTFCSCTADQVRLINQGYLGGSPKTPQTAFSLRLLRLYHLCWKHCNSNIQPFSLMIDEFLDAWNPVLLVPGTHKMIEELEVASLNLTKLEQLASNCAQCFGPAGSCGIRESPQYIVCVDGNFQHWQHKSASRHINEIQDPCTASHTAAADKRDGSSWRGSEETGLIGLVCHHDHCLKFVDVLCSGERNQLKNLRRRQRMLSEEDHNTLRALPSTLVALEESITEMVTDLGGQEFRNMPEVKGIDLK
ncbi:hypothetical protein DFH28DRAFT_1081035 [Melampsora americana]|nr:hypothetical protein DFH28DRAFT_1081035 [Melampsora americana]